MRWYTQPVPLSRDSVGYTRRRVMNVSEDWHDGARIEIALNSMCLLLDTRSSVQKIVETLVHEMIVSQVQSIKRILDTDADRSLCWLARVSPPLGQYRRGPPITRPSVSTMSQSGEPDSAAVYKVLYRAMVSEWAPHGIYGVACPSCMTPFGERLH